MIPIIISPTPELNRFASNQKYDLLLAHLTNSTEYADFYCRKKARRPYSYYILDNSAHELKEGQDIQTLLEIAEDLQIDELALPDVLFDGHRTFSNLIASMTELIALEDDGQNISRYRYMVVPQGKTLTEYVGCLTNCLAYYMSVQSGEMRSLKSPVIGISKDYNEMFDGGIDRLLEEHIIPVANQAHAQLHLLGWVEPLRDHFTIAQKHGKRIRTTDTARPFTYAMNGIDLQPYVLRGDFPDYPGRPEGFFDRKLTPDQIELTRSNIEVYTKLSMGDRVFTTTLPIQARAAQEYFPR